MLIAYALPALLGIAGCKPATGNADSLLHRAASIVGIPRLENVALHYKTEDVNQHGYESDRMYPPYLSDVTSVDGWYDPANGVERFSSHTAIFSIQDSPPTLMGNGDTGFLVRDTGLVANGVAANSIYLSRPLNVLAMLHDWLGSTGVTVTERCAYRDYERVVLQRTIPYGKERLYLDPKSDFPIKLDRTESHYLWGQIHVEFVYSTWQRVGDGYLPGESFRVVDGETEVESVPASLQFVPLDSAPRLTLPSSPAVVKRTLPRFLTPSRPDTTRVSANTFILTNPGYAEVVTLAHDTVYVFDATQSEERARLDSAWIGVLFPGHHPITLVVTDIAWPHVSGIRFWVARGATVISHRAARSFLQRVVDRRWTESPDLLERSRANVKFHFVPVSKAMTLANGAIKLYPIDGASSEVALDAYVEADRFLWASDFLQSLDASTTYLDETWRAAKREHVDPLRVAAEHLPLAPWSKVVPLAPAH